MLHTQLWARNEPKCRLSCIGCLSSILACSWSTHTPSFLVARAPTKGQLCRTRSLSRDSKKKKKKRGPCTTHPSPPPHSLPHTLLVLCAGLVEPTRKDISHFRALFGSLLLAKSPDPLAPCSIHHRLRPGMAGRDIKERGRRGEGEEAR
jgi:hypothetical protein